MHAASWHGTPSLTSPPKDDEVSSEVRPPRSPIRFDLTRPSLTFFFYSYKKFTTSFTFYYTYLATIQYYRDDAKGSEGQRLPQSPNIKTRNYTLHTTNCTPHTVKGQRILHLILFHIGCQIGVGKKFKKSHECRLLSHLTKTVLGTRPLAYLKHTNDPLMLKDLYATCNGNY